MGEKIKSFSDLKAWQQGHRLVLAIYKTTEDFPNKRKKSLINFWSKLRRSKN